MFPKVVICLIASFCASSAQNHSTSRENNWPYDLVTPFEYRTLSPIDVDTRDVRLVITPSPLKVVINPYDSVMITNTGNSVMVSATRPSSTSVTGSVLSNGIYTFQELEFFWSADCKGRASNSVDLVDAPLQARIAFRNVKYNRATSVIKRDGYAILVFNIHVEGYVDNPLFTPFGNLLQKITISGSSTPATLLPVFQWFNQVLATQHHYAFPGSYIVGVNYQYDCATIIHFPKAGSSYISIQQFALFLRLLSPQGTPITNVLGTYSRGRRPVVQVRGNTEFLVPAAG